jgi:xanthine dehydrogenase accessory factor
MRELLQRLLAAIRESRDCVYCSVVETRGSTPQKAGAAMLIFPDGSQHGTLGGGCVEAEVKQHALRRLSEGAKPDVLTFNLDDNYGWDDGLICGGRMSMLVDPINAVNGTADVLQSAYYTKYMHLVEGGRGCTEVIAIRTEAEVGLGSRYLFDGSGTLVSTLGDTRDSVAITDHLTPLARRPRPSSHRGFAYLPVLQRITLLIAGGGHVGQAVAQLAAAADFDIWVVDDREPFVSQERFPAAQKRLVGDIGATLKSLAATDINASTYCLIVTRGHAHDEEALYHLATSRAGFVGMIGSKRKIRMIYEDLVAKGIPVDALDQVHAPLGFEIGSQTVPEIAVSIVAELIACRNLGSAKPVLREPIKAGNVKP